jgi:hypothetical protein
MGKGTYNNANLIFIWHFVMFLLKQAACQQRLTSFGLLYQATTANAVP